MRKEVQFIINSLCLMLLWLASYCNHACEGDGYECVVHLTHHKSANKNIHKVCAM